MNASPPPAKPDLPHPGLIFLFLFLLAAVAVIYWLTFLPPAAAQAASPTPIRLRSFAAVDIAKPTYTPIPTATSIPTQPPTEAVAQAEIVSEALTYEYVASVTGEQAQAPAPYTGGKRILVDISEQRMYVYDGSQLIYNFTASTGMNNSTRVGSFSILNKIPSAYGSTWNIWMPHWLGIYWVGNLQNGIHGLPILPNGATLWAGYLGTPISYGCVALGAYESQLLYNWVDIGTPVDIQR